MKHLTALACCIALAVLAAGCGNKNDGAETGGQSGAAQEGKKATAAATTAPALSKATGFERIPRDALFVAAAESIEKLAVAIGRDALVERFRKQYDELVADMMKATQADLFDPKSLAKLGIDVGAPVGFAWLNGPDETAAFLFKLTDAAKIEAELKGIMERVGGQPVSESVGEARLLYDNRFDEVVHVLADGHLYSVFSGRRAKQAKAAAKSIAETKKGDSIAGDEAMSKALGALAFGRDVAGYLNTRAVIDAVMQEAFGDRHGRFLEDMAADARARGDAELAARYEENLREHQRARMMGMAKRKAAEVFARGLLGGLGGLALGLEVEPRALRLRAKMSVAEGALPRKVLGRGTGSPLLVRVLAEQPVYVLSGHANVQGVVDLVRSAALAAGGSREYEDVRGAIKQAIGFDFDQELATLVTGEIGSAVTAPADLSMKALKDGPKPIGGALLIGLKDPDRARKLLDDLVKLSPVPGLVETKESRIVVHVPEWRDVHVGIAGGYLAAATDASLLDRVAAADASRSFTAALANPGLKPVLLAENTSVTALLQWMATAWLMIARWSDYPEPPEPPAPPGVDAEAYAKKVAELQKVRAELQAANSAKQDRDNERVMRVMTAIGVMAANLTLDDHGLTLDGGQYVGGDSVTKVVGDTIADIVEGNQQSRAHWEQMDKLYDRQRELRAALDEMTGAAPMVLPAPVPFEAEPAEPEEALPEMPDEPIEAPAEDPDGE